MEKVSLNNAETVYSQLQTCTHPRRMKEPLVALKSYDDIPHATEYLPNAPELQQSEVLTLSNSRLTDHIHYSVTRLPHLRILRLIDCGIYAFSRSDHPEGNQPFTVKVLVLADVQIFHRSHHRIDDLPTSAMRDTNITIFPPPLLAGLISLEFRVETSPALPLHWLLSETPHLKCINVCCGQSAFSNPLPNLPVPRLTTFRGPLSIATGVIPSAFCITELSVSHALTRDQALTFLDNVSPVQMSNLELTLTQWDSDVLDAISSRFVNCKRFKVTYAGASPTGGVLRAIGREQLNRLPRIDTFLLCGEAPSLSMTRNTASAYEFLASIRGAPLLEVVFIHGSLWTREPGINHWTCRSLAS
ncbi:hypothetical protein DFH09DRAFT_1474744 [Mycena vulgaris]|nr:hypothetical protein DFH09DRAFT_1474744 [Mycena vulgaris]